jgi:hypothetical protein
MMFACMWSSFHPPSRLFNWNIFAGVLIMESLEHALKRGAPILAEYLGGGVSCDAYNMTDPHADGRGVAFCIERSLEDAGVSREEVCFTTTLMPYCPRL